MPDRVIYEKADGTQRVFRPATGTVENRDAVGIKVVRPDGNVGEWVPADIQVADPYDFGDADHPLPTNDIRRLFVSPAGDDANPGDRPDKPRLTIKSALGSIGQGKARLYLDHGGRWYDSFDAPTHGVCDYRRAGAPSDPPRVYGPTGRQAFAIAVRHSTAALIGLHVQSANADPREPAFRADRERTYGIWALPGVDLDVRRCVVRFFGANVRLGDDAGRPVGKVTLADSLIGDAWGPASDADPWDRHGGHGVYGAWVTLDATRTAFLNNGWTPKTLFATGARNGNGFRHAVYGAAKAGGGLATFVECPFVGNGSYGIQARNGSRAVRCIFDDNAVHFGAAGKTFDATSCYFGATHAAKRFDGVESGGVAAWSWAADATIADCVFAAGIKVPVSLLRREGKAGEDWTPPGRMSLRGTGSTSLAGDLKPNVKGSPNADVSGFKARPATDADRELAKRVAAFRWRERWHAAAVAELLGN